MKLSVLILLLSVGCATSKSKETVEEKAVEAGEESKDEVAKTENAEKTGAESASAEGQTAATPETQQAALENQNQPEAGTPNQATEYVEGGSAQNNAILGNQATPQIDQELQAGKAPEAQMPVEPQEVVDKSFPTFYPTTSLLNMRTGPGTSYGVAKVVRFGQEIELTDEQHGVWRKATDGSWVSMIYLANTRPQMPTDPRASTISYRKEEPEEPTPVVKQVVTPTNQAEPADQDVPVEEAGETKPEKAEEKQEATAD